MRRVLPVSVVCCHVLSLAAVLCWRVAGWVQSSHSVAGPPVSQRFKPCRRRYSAQLGDSPHHLNLDGVPSLRIFKIPTGFLNTVGARLLR